MLLAALPKYLSLGWPEPSAVARCREQVPEPSVLWSRPQLVASWISLQHHSPGTACPPAPHVRCGEDGPVMAAQGGRAEQLLPVSPSSLPVEKGTLLHSYYQPSPSNPVGNIIAQKLSHLV